MSENLSALLYLVASVLFVLSLRGLSSPQTARQGNLFGIVGMAIAILTTLAGPHVLSYWLILVAILIGGSIGSFIAWRIQMTALPQLVAAFHSLVGLAAVFVALATFSAPDGYGITDANGIKLISRIEMAIGLAIGAVTFTGSIIAFGKLQALISGKPLVFPGQ
ncbi:MAG: NAD(P)(+) transhydrogenase (Re/Si-specific) subunit beta, partial [Elstera sp.]